MAMTSGTRLGPYEILAAIGAGGMGEVYRARDTKLDRDVAIKILPDSFAHDPERIARFTREAKTLAALNHPHIAQIYGLEETPPTGSGQAGMRALVMELVEGPTLADRISGLPIPLEEALPIARQVAEALEAAHERGIIHRDLKPANIKLRDDGTVKVLDFGLAKLAPGATGVAQDFSPAPAEALGDSPTVSSPAAITARGVILGTAAYMAPEQAKGRIVDKRADIWAFGCVLYEMLTGRRAFPGDDVFDILTSVIKSDPDWEALPRETPAVIRRLLRRCLVKDHRQRLGDIRDARLDIDDAQTTPAADAGPMPVLTHRWWQRPLTIAVAALIAGASISGVAVWRLTWPTSQRPVRFAVSPDSAARFFLAVNSSDVTISPDGQRIAYLVNDSEGIHLEVRMLDQLTPARLAPTGRIYSPFFSPDSEWIGFSDETRPAFLKKVPVRGGPAVTICSLPGSEMLGASWGPDDTITFATRGLDGGLWQVPATGGEPKRLTAPDKARGELGHLFPDILPGGEAVVFTILANRVENSSVAVLKLATGEQTVLVRGGSDPKYVSTGHLVYGVQGTLRAVGFDPVRLNVLGNPVPLVEGVVTKASGAADFDIAANGSLVYASGGATQAGQTLAWVDREGHEERVDVAPRIYHVPRVSPDGSRVVVHTENDGEIWTLDLARGTSTRLTFDPAFDGMPLWTPDGKRIVFRSGRDGGGLFSTSADGTGEAEPLTKEPVTQSPLGWSRDGTLLVTVGHGGERGNTNSQTLDRADIGIVPMGGERSVKWLLHTKFEERRPAISPDGRWMAYDSDESGQIEVYVRPFPNVNEGRWQVSVDGGQGPLWSRDGQELFYTKGIGRVITFTMLRVPVQVAPRFSAGRPEVLFEGPYATGLVSDHRMYDLAPDGRFLLLSSQTGSSGQLIVVVNWQEELKRLVATR